ncbi:YXWGXW repeat-containing protein [Roseivirga misakiensis]|uniref:Uncharacterized protein n=1 Tax=Roseivirga misakiensis TaxID=1563681 RepID=A0A1E5T4W1_9BACT|nr:YXWGXW repeat-containing protein [Roseivirga misakiensis]OEK06409.1 hypothetical protein BFP71_01655 [Roseivirga misakiensis]
MKKALLTLAILLFTGLSVEVLAQRKRSDDRSPRKEATLNNRRDADLRNSRNNRNSNIRNNKRNNKAYVKNNRRADRVVRVVDRRVSRDRGWTNYGYADTRRNNRSYYDFDARRGRRILVNRGYRPSNRHIWLAGYWSYNPRLRRDVWVEGRWAIRRANHRWIAGHYQRVNGRRVWIDGCWTIRL